MVIPLLGNTPAFALQTRVPVPTFNASTAEFSVPETSIISVSPEENATGVALTSSVTILFSANIKNCNPENYFTLKNDSGDQISGEISFDSDRRTLTFVPSDLLSNQTTYTAVFDMNGGGSCQASKTWYFTTTNILASVSPANGAVDLPRATNIYAYYNFDTTSCDTSNMVVWDGSSYITGEFNTYGAPDNFSEFIPDEPFDYESVITVRLTLSGSAICNYQTTWSFTIEDDPTAVFLLYFIGTPYPTNDGVLLEWETASEFGNIGFNIYRADSLNGPWSKLNNWLIPSLDPGGMMGAYYSWDDTNGIAPDHTYYYILEDVDIYGVRTQHGPIEVVVGNR